MDKICRGSRIAEARGQGAGAASTVPAGAVGRRLSSGEVSPRAARPQNASPSAKPTQPPRLKPQTPDVKRSLWETERCCRGTPQSEGCPSPRFWTGGGGSPASPRSWMQRSRSAQSLGKAELDATPGGLRSPQERGHRRSDGAGSPSPERMTSSKTYSVSEDWMGYSSPRGEREGAREEAEVSFMMPSSNFSSRLRRQQSGRITENSDNWLRSGGETAEPGPPVIANSENYSPSRGKKTAFAISPGSVRGRLKMDASQQEPQRSQRRHDFAEGPQSPRQQLSPRSPPQPVAREASGGGGGAQTQGGLGTMHRTSSEMAASLMPEAGESSGAVPTEQRKYMVGNELVDWQRHGRRAVAACMGQALQGGMSPRSTSMTCLRDHRNSDVVREQMQLPIRAPPEQPSTPALAAPSAAQPSVQLTPNTRVVDQRVYSFGEFSSVPSAMPRDAAYIHAGVKVVKYTTRSPGAFSPNVVRVPAAQVLQP